MRIFSEHSRFPSSLLIAVFLLLSLGVLANAALPVAGMEQRWQHIKELQQELSTDAPKGVNEVEHFAPIKARLHQESMEFAASFPSDPLRWDARLLVVKTTSFPIPIEERNLIFRENEKTVADIVAAVDATREVKQTAVRTILFQHLDHLDLIASPQVAATLEDRLLSFLKAYPDDPKAASLQLRRADLVMRIDPSRVKPLLDELSASSDPKIAAAARGRMAQAVLASAPLDWKYIALDGREVDLAKLRGRVILIDYWASWCPDCLRALPQVLAAYRKYHEKGFEVVGVSLDSDQEALLSFLKKREMLWPEIYDGKGRDGEIVTKYGVGGIPEMWLVGKDGRVTATSVQPNELDGKIASLLNQ